MIKTNKEQAREALRKWAVKYSGGCDIQEGETSGGWPCGTCFISLLNEVGLTSTNDAYSDRNKDVDRANEVWRAILQIREAKLTFYPPDNI